MTTTVNLSRLNPDNVYYDENCNNILREPDIWDLVLMTIRIQVEIVYLYIKGKTSRYMEPYFDKDTK